MRIKKHVHFFKTSLASCIAAYLVLTGCVGNRELLEIPLPQSYFLPNSPIKVWKATLLAVSKPTNRILVSDEAAHLLSWVNAVEPDERLHGSLTDPDVASGDGEIIVITVVRVEDSPGGSRLTIRSTYCSAKELLGNSSSRGNYEQEVLWAIKTSLISEAANHVKK